MDITGYEYLPSSPVIDDLIFLLIAAPDLGLLPEIHKVSPGRSVTIDKLEGNDQAQTVTFINDSSHICITIPRLSDLQRGTIPARDLFLILLILMAKNCIRKGKLCNPRIEFTLKDLVSSGCYKSTHTAKTGLESAMKLLMTIQVSWTTRKNKKTQLHSRVLFTGCDISSGKCNVQINTEIDWSFIMKFFTLLPSCYPTLPRKAADLLYLVMYLLRQNIPHILKDQAFSIKLPTIMVRLALPSPSISKNPKRDVWAPIEDAVSQINRAVKAEDLRLELSAPTDKKTTEKLKLGKTIVHVGGTPLAYYRTIPEKAHTKQEAVSPMA